jgi:hypothetical protein
MSREGSGSFHRAASGDWAVLHLNANPCRLARHCSGSDSLEAQLQQGGIINSDPNFTNFNMPDSTLPDAPPVAVKPPSLVKAIIKAALLILIDAFLLNQGFISALVGFWLIVIGLPLALRRKNAPVRRQKLRDLGIYALAVVLVFVLNALNNRLAESRANDLIVAVNAFHAKHQRYPQTLEELTPEFLAAVPVAKYTLGGNRFIYRASEGDAWFFYTDFPPFGRRTYNFKSGKRGYID